MALAPAAVCPAGTFELFFGADARLAPPPAFLPSAAGLEEPRERGAAATFGFAFCVVIDDDDTGGGFFAAIVVVAAVLFIGGGLALAVVTAAFNAFGATVLPMLLVLNCNCNGGETFE